MLPVHFHVGLEGQSFLSFWLQPLLAAVFAGCGIRLEFDGVAVWPPD